MDKVKYYQIPGEGVVAYIDFVEGLEPGLYDHQGVEYLINEYEFELKDKMIPILKELRKYNKVKTDGKT